MDEDLGVRKVKESSVKEVYKYKDPNGPKYCYEGEEARVEGIKATDLKDEYAWKKWEEMKLKEGKMNGVWSNLWWFFLYIGVRLAYRIISYSLKGGLPKVYEFLIQARYDLCNGAWRLDGKKEGLPVFVFYRSRVKTHWSNFLGGFKPFWFVGDGVKYYLGLILFFLLFVFLGSVVLSWVFPFVKVDATKGLLFLGVSIMSNDTLKSIAYIKGILWFIIQVLLIILFGKGRLDKEGSGWGLFFLVVLVLLGGFFWILDLSVGFEVLFWLFLLFPLVILLSDLYYNNCTNFYNKDREIFYPGQDKEGVWKYMAGGKGLEANHVGYRGERGEEFNRSIKDFIVSKQRFNFNLVGLFFYLVPWFILMVMGYNGIYFLFKLFCKFFCLYGGFYVFWFGVGFLCTVLTGVIEGKVDVVFQGFNGVSCRGSDLWYFKYLRFVKNWSRLLVLVRGVSWISNRFYIHIIFLYHLVLGFIGYLVEAHRRTLDCTKVEYKKEVGESVILGEGLDGYVYKFLSVIRKVDPAPSLDLVKAHSKGYPFTIQELEARYLCKGKNCYKGLKEMGYPLITRDGCFFGPFVGAVLVFYFLLVLGIFFMFKGRSLFVALTFYICMGAYLHLCVELMLEVRLCIDISSCNMLKVLKSRKVWREELRHKRALLIMWGIVFGGMLFMSLVLDFYPPMGAVGKAFILRFLFYRDLVFFVPWAFSYIVLLYLFCFGGEIPAGEVFIRAPWEILSTILHYMEFKSLCYGSSSYLAFPFYGFFYRIVLEIYSFLYSSILEVVNFYLVVCYGVMPEVNRPRGASMVGLRDMLERRGKLVHPSSEFGIFDLNNNHILEPYNYVLDNNRDYVEGINYKGGSCSKSESYFWRGGLEGREACRDYFSLFNMDWKVYPLYPSKEPPQCGNIGVIYSEYMGKGGFPVETEIPCILPCHIWPSVFLFLYVLFFNAKVSLFVGKILVLYSIILIGVVVLFKLGTYAWERLVLEGFRSVMWRWSKLALLFVLYVLFFFVSVIIFLWGFINYLSSFFLSFPVFMWNHRKKHDIRSALEDSHFLAKDVARWIIFSFYDCLFTIKVSIRVLIDIIWVERSETW
uniref:hypothetical protein n=1 Tax=Sphaeromyxa zaharoni TaxID=275449 RepID=UPI003002C438